MTPRRVRDTAFCLLSTLLLLATQYGSGAFTADLALDPDEPAHAVSSLVVRDYIVQAFPHNPIHFAWTFYAHYPKVAIGHWPPLFYFGEAIWMLLVGRSQVALLLFVTLCGAALVNSFYFEVRRRSSTAAALVSVAVLMSSRVFHQMLCGIRPDILLALMIFWAAVHCGEFMRLGSRRSRNFFLAFTVAALLVHGRGAVLFLLPFALLPLRSRVVKWKWLMAGAVLLLLMLMPHLLHQAPPLSLHAFLPRARDFILSIVFVTGWPWRIRAVDGVTLVSGWPWAVLAVSGMSLVFRQGRQQQFWAAMAGLVGCSLCFYLLVPVPLEYRFLLTSMQAVAVLAGGGIDVLLQRILPYRGTPRLVLSAAAIGWMVWATAHVEAKPDLGYRRMIENCLLCGNDVVLIAGDERNEGGLIVEASLSDPDRVHTVMRASKSLAISGWLGWDRRLLFSSSSEVLHSLDQAHVSLILVQKECPYPQVAQLRTVLAQNAAEWHLVPGASQRNEIEVYRKTPAQDVPSN